MNKINVAIGAVAGVAAGALVGVFFAPDKGTETRKKISTKSKEAADSVKNKVVHAFSKNGGKAKGVPQMQQEDDMN